MTEPTLAEFLSNLAGYLQSCYDKGEPQPYPRTVERLDEAVEALREKDEKLDAMLKQAHDDGYDACMEAWNLRGTGGWNLRGTE